LILEIFGYTVLMEPPIIEVFVGNQYEIKRPAWSGKTIESLASLLDCHKT
jgi:hypothetical protein